MLLFALALAAFSIRLAELLPMRILNEIADTYHIHLSTVGKIVSFYALGVIAGIPLASLTIKYTSRKLKLLILLSPKNQ